MCVKVWLATTRLWSGLVHTRRQSLTRVNQTLGVFQLITSQDKWKKDEKRRISRNFNPVDHVGYLTKHEIHFYIGMSQVQLYLMNIYVYFYEDLRLFSRLFFESQRERLNSALLACEGIPLVISGFPSQRDMVQNAMPCYHVIINHITERQCKSCISDGKYGVNWRDFSTLTKFLSAFNTFIYALRIGY